MKYPCMIVTLAVMSSIVFSCKQKSSDTVIVSESVEDDTVVVNPEVDNFNIKQQFKSLSQLYKVNAGDNDAPVYVAFDANIQWPLKYGNYKVKALQDTIIGAILQGKTQNVNGIDEALVAWANNFSRVCKGVTSPDAMELVGENTLIKEQHPYGSDKGYLTKITAKITEINDQTVTYHVSQVLSEPDQMTWTSSTMFTFDINQGRVLTYDDLLLPDAKPGVLPYLQSALQSLYYADDEKQLKDMGIFVDQLFLSKDVFITDGQLVFHYQAGSIGVVKLGEINVPIAPFAIEEYLTPEAKKLLLE